VSVPATTPQVNVAPQRAQTEPGDGMAVEVSNDFPVLARRRMAAR